MRRRSPGTPPRRAAGRQGFTLVEVLATTAMLAIALPVIMEGVSLATATASVARCRTDAAALAEARLNELAATGTWETGGAMAGDYSPTVGGGGLTYHWTAQVLQWQQPGLQQLDVHVTWLGRRGQEEVVVTTLVYNGVNASTSSTGSSSGSSGASGSGSGTKSGAAGGGAK